MQTIDSRPTSPTIRPQRWQPRLDVAEPWLALVCAALLLLTSGPLALIAAVLGTAPLAIRTLRTGWPWPPTVLDLPLGLLLLSALPGAWAALDASEATARLNGLLAGLLLYAAAAQHAGRPVAARRIVWGALAGAIAAGLLLSAASAPFLRSERVPFVTTIRQTLDPEQALGVLSAGERLGQWYRLRASGVGAVAGIGLALIATLATGTRSRRVQLALVPPAALSVSLLAAADNRGAVVATAASLAAIAIIRRPRMIPLVALVTVVAVLALTIGLTTRGLSPRTLGQRAELWENSLYLARDLPFTGVGLGLTSTRRVYAAYFPPHGPYPPTPFLHAHNIFVQLVLEQGVLGVIGMAGLVAGTLHLAWRLPALPARYRREVGIAGLAVATVLLVIGQTEVVPVTTLGLAILLGSIGVVAGATSHPADDGRAQEPHARPAATTTSGRPWPRGPLVVAGLALALVLAVPFWQPLAGRLLGNLGIVELHRATLSTDATPASRAATLARASWLLGQASALTPDDPALWRSLARVYVAQQDLDAAQDALERARQLIDPDDWRGEIQLRQLYVALSRAPEPDESERDPP